MATAHQFTAEADPRAAYNAMLARDAERKAELAAFIAAHDDVLDGTVYQRGAIGSEYSLTVQISDGGYSFPTIGIGSTPEAARASAIAGVARADAAMRDLILPVVRAYVGSAL